MEFDRNRHIVNHENPSLALSTWGASLLHAPSIESMERQQDEIYERVFAQRVAWLKQKHLHHILPRMEELFAGAFPIRLVTDLPHVIHSPVRDDPNTPHRIVISDSSGGCEVNLLNAMGSEFRNMIGLSLPRRQVLRENSWHSPVMLASELRVYGIPDIIHVENPPDAPDKQTELKPGYLHHLHAKS